MRRLAKFICAGSLLLAFAAGLLPPAVAFAKEVTIEGGGYIGYTSDWQPDSSSSDGGSGGSSSSDGGSTPGGGQSSSDGGGQSSGGGGQSSDGGGQPSDGGGGGGGGATTTSTTTTSRAASGTASGTASRASSAVSSATSRVSSSSQTASSSTVASSSQASSSQAESLPEPEVPEAPPPVDVTGWGLANLLMSLLVLAVGVILLVRTLVRRRGGVLNYIVSVLSLAPIILFLLLESFTEMWIFNKWTPLFAVLFVCYMTLSVFAFLNARKQEEDEKYVYEKEEESE